ncbi:MAG: hypothetical protein JO320_09035, partial [Alphaproteobacteria bacterium]|nr:hypothetical protein [Alphaproteobacteria bacterium]
MVEQVFYTALAWDLPDDSVVVAQALAEGRRTLAEEGLSVPALGDWNAFRLYLDDLFEGRRTFSDGDQSKRIADAGDAIGRASPVAALVAGFAAVAEWEGPSRYLLLRTSQGATNWGWHGLVLPLARNLLRADAVWSASSLA